MSEVGARLRRLRAAFDVKKAPISICCSPARERRGWEWRLQEEGQEGKEGVSAQVEPDGEESQERVLSPSVNVQHVSSQNSQ